LHLPRSLSHAVRNCGVAGEAAPEVAAEATPANPVTGLDKVGTGDKPITFANPGKLDGIVGKRKAVLRMSNVSFKYDAADKAILTDASGVLCLASRVALIGANGAGKTPSAYPTRR
jgi:ATPase subunit of ABC transporter with duplicated ATPase domains